MSIEKTWQTNSTSSDATERLGERLGQQLKGGEVIELVSDLGGGKTTFVRGLARGMGSTDRVASPTFTISKVYTTDKLRLNHYDLYRLIEAGLVQNEIHDAINDPSAVTVIEWGDLVQNSLPLHRLRIIFKVLGEHDRQISLSCPETLNYLLEKLC